MLQLWQDITGQVSYTKSDRETFKGMEAFVNLKRTFMDGFNVSSSEPDESKQSRQAFVTIAIETRCRVGRIELKPYFRMLFYVVQIVDESKGFTLEERETLVGIVKAYLSEAELVIIFYNMMLPTMEKMVPLVRKYGLFQNIEYVPQHHFDQAYLLNLKTSPDPQ